MQGAQTCGSGSPATSQETHHLGPCHFNVLKQTCWGRGLDLVTQQAPEKPRKPKSEVPGPDERDSRCSSLSIHPQRSLFSPRP